ncbi:MAG: hypothetical protein QF466_03675 [Desulfobacterales bacterium]|jgi:CBS domain-containing protein|nr:hypothetical protein [Desulfobacter sp.]MDP6394535.1 hypothetical protein [Desulfobacterales bacterium]MDP6683778.1 hypothetical protein [Desulfobacterales bacterium]MDP6806167.1 hypothetical protein [Desulfobacterales bacterium]|tara:strand:+ start:59796 stop:60638 length:843 start_codon:yes stop_codon:yes gene_type:complete
MPVKKSKPYKKTIGILVALVAALSVLFVIVLREDEKEVSVIKGKIEKASKPVEIEPGSERTTEPIIVPTPPIDYNKIEKDREMRALMKKRKERFGIDKGVDIIIKSNESIKVGTITVPMKEILDKIRLKKGDLIIEDLMLKPLPTISHHEPKEQIMREEKLEGYGIYVVRENDNIWNIHFSFLKNFFQHKGVLLEAQSDEPDKKGVSSGVGKILKFSEHMVYIYNIKERKLDVDLDLLYPLSKIVIFNMGEVFSLLNQIDYDHISQIQYDGETIWIPGKQ